VIPKTLATLAILATLTAKMAVDLPTAMFEQYCFEGMRRIERDGRECIAEVFAVPRTRNRLRRISSDMGV
jgi:hypothetical protein